SPDRCFPYRPRARSAKSTPQLSNETAMNAYRPWLAAASCVGAALLSNLACGAPRLAVAKPPAGLQDVSAEIHGRVSNDRYQWPGLYFEAKFSGRSVYFKTGAGDVILNALVDGHLVGALTKPASG